MAVNNKSTFYHGDNDTHDNDDSFTSMVVDNDSNCLRDTSDSNESSSFLIGTRTYDGWYWRVKDWTKHHCAAKYTWNFVHSGAVMTVCIHFEHTI